MTQFYELRTYHLRKDARQGDVEEFIATAAMPAMKRAGAAPMGVFLPLEPATDDPTLHLLNAYGSMEELMKLRAAIMSDRELMKAGAKYFDAPANDPPYARMESSLMRSFEGMPKLEAPDTGKPRIFELRTYESHSETAHLTKVGMFNNGEIAIFRRSGLKPVFFGSTLVGPKMPNLTYMLTFDDMAAHDKAWSAFVADPEWKKLSATPGLTDREIVSHITRVFLKPAACSQI